MTDHDRECIKILVGCKTLAVADRQLADLFPCTAARFGVFDGFNARPESIAGLTSEKAPDVAICAAYAKSFKLGERLRKQIRRAVRKRD